MKHIDTDTNFKEQTEFFDFFDTLWFDQQFKNDESLPSEVESLEKARIHNALDTANGNRTHAAKILGIGRTNLIAKIKKYNILYVY
tara:strand:- start:189 stop:446 length:258 start_codon:yes stop_codon:yes gene_type:complete